MQNGILKPRRERVVSIDVFRGLTILVMVFVNDVASVKGLPWWTYHIPPGAQGLTYVDVVFPAFLFIVGMAIPLAIDARISKGQSTAYIWLHILVRTFSLVAIGLLIMNGRDLDPQTSGLDYGVWNVAMLVAAILFWSAQPRAEGTRKRLYQGLRWTSLAVLLFLLWKYRRVEDGEVLWMDLENWSILGTIGWAYLSCCILYFLSGKRFWPLLASFGALIVMNVATKVEWVTFTQTLPRIAWPFGSGSHASIVMAGVLLSMIFGHGPKPLFKTNRVAAGIGLMAILFVAGWLLVPFGLAKIGATPSYCLLTAGICAASFLALYWIVDVYKVRRWAVLIHPAGSNALLTYLLPDIFYAGFGLNYLSELAGTGWPGVVRALGFTLFILGVAAVLTRMKIRMRV